ncbi:LysR family transcriptional regulator [Streptomyces sp. NPDC048428]|uniref:LysR family transcriptional regulator n=1 Tax=Streptomyces sp. NPDC048428 TaxID=3154503 RepID=UPI00343E5324
MPRRWPVFGVPCGPARTEPFVGGRAAPWYVIDGAGYAILCLAVAADTAATCTSMRPATPYARRGTDPEAGLICLLVGMRRRPRKAGTMDFRQLEYFKAVVEAGSVSQAAKNLNMTQPPVSHAIAKLEAELGVRLLDRTAKGVHPTSAGLYLLSKGGRLVEDRNRAVETLKLMGEGALGELRIGVEPMVINEIIADVLAEFLDQAPGVRVGLTDVTPDVIVQGIRDGRLDMGCIPFGPSQFAGFVADFCDSYPVMDIDIKLAVPRNRAREEHPDGKGWGRWILPYRIPAFVGMPDVVEAALSDDDSFEVLEVSTPQTALAFVAAGLGVAPVTQRIAARSDAVALLDPPRWLAPMQATLLWSREAEISPLMERWLQATRTVAEHRRALGS